MIHVLRFVGCWLLGLSGHQLHYVIDFVQRRSLSGRAWFRLARYAVGAVLLWLGLLYYTDKRCWEAQSGRYWKGAVPVGLGVATGYLWDALVEQRETPPGGRGL